MLQFPPELTEILLSYIKQAYLKKSLKARCSPFNEHDFRYFSRGAGRLSQAFTEERESRPDNYFNDPVCRSGYLLYFLPVNFLKIVRIFEQGDTRELVTGKIRVLDLGSGPGTSMLGLMAFYESLLRAKKIGDAWLEFTLADKNHAVLRDARHLHELYAAKLRQPGFNSACFTKDCDLKKGDLKRILRNYRYHYIVLGNILNEFSDRASQVNFIKEVLDHLDPQKGKLVIIEPAAKTTSRNLQFLRDQLVTRDKLAFVHAPCLHQEVCPLNVVNKRDWCHFYFSWDRPKFIEKVDRLIGNQKDWLACSYLVLSHGKRLAMSQEETHRNTWRVISNRMPSKGKLELVVCGPPGRYHLTRLDRDRSSINKTFGDLRRGDLVRLKVPFKPYDADGRHGIRKDDEVVKL